MEKKSVEMEKDNDMMSKVEFDSSVFGTEIRKGFKSFYESLRFSDLVLVVGKEKIQAHRVVISAWSKKLSDMVHSVDYSKGNELVIPLESSDVEKFRTMLTFMYTGEINVLNDDVMGLLRLAFEFGIIPLVEACGAVIGESVSDQNVFFMLDIAEKFNCFNLKKVCAGYLAAHFADLLKGEKLFELDVDTWSEMLKSDDIEVPSEADIFKALARFADKFKTLEEKRKVIEKILPSVRMNLLPGKILLKLEKSPIYGDMPLVKQLLYETFKYKSFPSAKPSYSVRPRKGTRWFDEAKIATSLSLSEDKKTAKFSGNANYQWMSARLLPEIPRGTKSYIEFKVNTMSGNGFFIGVATETACSNLTGWYVGQTGHSWAYEGTGGHFYYQGSTIATRATYHTGDRIGIMINTDGKKGKLSFWKNGQEVATVDSFNTSLIGQDKLYAIATMYSPGDQVTVLPISSPDTPFEYDE